MAFYLALNNNSASFTGRMFNIYRADKIALVPPLPDGCPTENFNFRVIVVDMTIFHVYY
jgi:hypothetical protein